MKSQTTDDIHKDQNPENCPADLTDDEKIDFVAKQILEKFRPAFEELAE